jgi:hypothetical protein
VQQIRRTKIYNLAAQRLVGVSFESPESPRMPTRSIASSIDDRSASSFAVNLKSKQAVIFPV